MPERADIAGEVEFHCETLPPPGALEYEWRTLETFARPSFFTSWHWIGTLLAALPRTQLPSLLHGVAGGRTAALALLGSGVSHRRNGLVRSRGLYLNETGDPYFDALTIEHNGILAAAGREAAVFDAALAWFAGLGAEADELHFNGSLLRPPEEAVEGRGLGRVETVVPSYSVDLRQLSPSGELDPVLSANARQQLRRAFRQFERTGPLQLSAATTTGEALDFFAGLKTLHCASWERRSRAHAFTRAFFEPFHRLLIERSFAAGGVQLLKASVGDRVIGYLYNFRLGTRIYAYQSGFADADRHERPGIVTHALAIRHAFRSGAGVYDLMAGRNRLKESLATRCEPMLWQIFQQPRLAFRLEHLGRRLKQVLDLQKPLSAAQQKDRKNCPARPARVELAS
ncbi:MAG TPA: GNAT family N-acetyltransferase [Stellaceae bacterium]|nr:GNAT family N-acetyltransferase [Stellaceae bacterium]